MNTVGVGHESTDSYVVFPSDPETGPRMATAELGRAMASLSKQIRQRGVEVSHEDLVENAAARTHLVAIDGLRSALLRREDEDIRVVHGHPLGSNDEQRCVADLVTDLVKLTSTLEPAERTITACIRQERACIVVEDGEWLAFRSHAPRQAGLVLAAIHRFGHFTQSPGELHGNGTNRT